MKVVFLIFVLIHGAIHLLGFVKAFQLAEVQQLTQQISRPVGMLWIIAAVLFVASLCLLAIDNRSWWIVAFAAVVLSQVLIFQAWDDAKFGTMANVVILVPVILSFMNALPSSYRNRYETEVRMRLHSPSAVTVVGEDDLQHLPAPVQKYLRYVGAVGRPKVRNFRAVFEGGMKRTPEGDWLDIRSMQYNFLNDPARLFYIESSMFGIPYDGLHVYTGSNATMQIKVASLVQVVDAKGEKMNQGETVTLFNDMCLLAPPALIDPSITWESVDALSVRATFTNKGNTIVAVLSFNEKGELTRFVSNDRYLSSDGITYLKYPWSTPVRDYRDVDGRKVASYGEAAWQTPEGEFVYAKFDLKEIEYNCTHFR